MCAGYRSAGSKATFPYHAGERGIIYEPVRVVVCTSDRI